MLQSFRGQGEAKYKGFSDLVELPNGCTKAQQSSAPWADPVFCITLYVI